MSSFVRLHLLIIVVGSLMAGCIPRFTNSTSCRGTEDCFKGERCDVIRASCVPITDATGGSTSDASDASNPMDMANDAEPLVDAGDGVMDANSVTDLGATTDGSRDGDRGVMSDVSRAMDAMVMEDAQTEVDGGMQAEDEPMRGLDGSQGQEIPDGGKGV